MKKIVMVMACVLTLPILAQQNDVPVALLPDNGRENTVDTDLLKAAEQGVDNVAPHSIETSQGIITNGILSDNESNPPPWSGYQAAESLAREGNPELALKQLEARLSIAPDDAKAAYLKGLILMQLGRGEDAERWFKMMQSNYPKLPQSYNALAVIYTARGDLAQAQTVLEALLTVTPDYENAQINLGNIHLKRALMHYQYALKIQPSHATLAEKVKLLQTLEEGN